MLQRFSEFLPVLRLPRARQVLAYAEQAWELEWALPPTGPGACLPLVEISVLLGELFSKTSCYAHVSPGVAQLCAKNYASRLVRVGETLGAFATHSDARRSVFDTLGCSENDLQRVYTFGEALIC